MAEQWAQTDDHAPDPNTVWADTGQHSPAERRTWADKLGIAREGGIGSAAARNVVDFGEGAASGLASTVFQGGDLIRRGLGMNRIINTPQVQQEMAAPDSVAGKAGKIGEQIAEFAIPAGMAAEATKGASLLARTGAEALSSGAVSALQSGGNPTATALGVVGGAAGPLTGGALKGTASAIFNRVANSAPRPLSQAAIDIASKYGVPLTKGMLGGSKTVQAVEKMLGHTVAPDLYEALMEGTQRGVQRAASDLTGGFSKDYFAAGDSTVSKLLNTASTHERDARKAYDFLESVEADPANISRIPAGVGEDGAQAWREVSLPVDMKAAKLQVRPIVEMIRKQIPVGQQQYSRGLQAAQNILDGEDVVSASTADSNLSALKQILRESVDPKVKRLTSQVIDAVSPQVDTAVSNAGIDAMDALITARKSWRTRSEILDLVDQLSGDTTGKTGQTTAARRLLAPADASYPTIQKVLAVSPGAADDLGKAYLLNVFKKASTGDFTNPTMATNLWNQIGKRTKSALFSADQLKDIDATLELAKRINENPNPSGTGIINSLLKLGVLATHPVGGTAAIVFGRNAAKTLYDPQGAAALRGLLQGNPQGKALTLLKSIVEKGSEATGEGMAPRELPAPAAAAPQLPEPPQVAAAKPQAGVLLTTPDGQIHAFENEAQAQRFQQLVQQAGGNVGWPQ